MPSTQRLILLVTLLFLMAGGISANAAVGSSLTLPFGEEFWLVEVSETGGYALEESATLVMGEDMFQVGPWLAGEYAARYAYFESFDVFAGSIKGKYRTEDTIDGQVEVVVNWLNSVGASLFKEKFRLVNAPNWTEFSLPVRRIPEYAVKVAFAFGNAVKNEGRVFFRELAVTEEPWSVEFPNSPPLLTRNPAPKSFEPSQDNTWRAEQFEGTWWLVRPNGEPFYALALDTFTASGLETHSLELLGSANFNTMGAWSDLIPLTPVNDVAQEPFAAVYALENGTLPGDFNRVVSAEGERPDGHTMPDPFDPRWKAALKSRVELIKEIMDGKPWFIGCFVDNEARHYDLHRCVYSPDASKAFKAWLKDKYIKVENLNAIWGAKYESFDALIAAKPDPIKREGQMYLDFKAFKRVLVQQYVDVTLETFAEVYDHNPPLLIGPRLTVDLSDVWDVLDIYGEAYDVLALNVYPGNLQVGLPEYAIRQLRDMYQLTGRPIIIGEWSVPALDSGLYEDWSRMDWSYLETVDTQKERAGQAAFVTAQFFNMPYVIGSNWYIWHDNIGGRLTNRGLFKEDGMTPWPELHEALQDVNGRIQKYFMD